MSNNLLQDTISSHDVVGYIIAGIAAVTAISNSVAQLILDDAVSPYLYVAPVYDIEPVLREIRALSEGILSLNDSLSASSPALAIERYRALLELHGALENIFEEWQTIIMRLERMARYVHEPWAQDVSDMFRVSGDQIRDHGNLLVRAIRSLEDNIRDRNPAFVFLTRQWFE